MRNETRWTFAYLFGSAWITSALLLVLIQPGFAQTVPGSTVGNDAPRSGSGPLNSPPLDKAKAMSMKKFKVGVCSAQLLPKSQNTEIALTCIGIMEKNDRLV